MTIPSTPSRPSISERSWVTTRSVTPESACPLFGARASISSKKIIAGDTCRALLNISLMCFSLSPTHLLNSSGPLIAMKFASDSFATAFARSVFPLPGTPYSRIPLGDLMPILLNAPGCLRGHSTISLRFCFTSSRPPTSFQVIFGISTRTSRIADGSTNLRAFLKSSMVTTRDSSIFWSIVSSFRLTFGSILRSADIAASLHRADRSAPTKPCVVSAILLIATSLRGMFLVCIWRISLRPCLSGTPISISLSNLPGLLSAGSRAFSRLVAARTIT